jgi:hypothetical protein
MKYILMGISVKYDDEMLVNDLIGKIATKVKVERMNHTYGNGMCLIVFESKVNFGKLKLMVSEIMNLECPMYFLYKHDTKSSLTSIPDSYHNVLDLDNPICGVSMVKKENDIILDFIDFMKIINCDDMNDFEISPEQKKEPTLDEILDKICESGYDSLSLSDKEILNNYSKN